MGSLKITDQLMTNKVLFLTGLFPEEIREEIIRDSKFNIQFAADALQWSFVEGLSFYYKDIKVLNFPFVGSYPTLYKTTAIKQIAFGKQMGFDGLNMSYFNFIAIKNIDIYHKAKKKIIDWAQQNTEEKTILIYSAFLPFLNAAIAAKKEFKNLKVFLILPDIPEFMGGPDNIFYKVFKKYTNDALQKSFEQVDGYILVSKYMTERLPTENKKLTVVEGIFNDERDGSFQQENKSDKKIILYTGTLAKRYGILGLLEAFKQIRNDNYRLVICGDGDAREDILLAAAMDQRIIYKGSIDRPEVLKMQKEASLLVNPRTAEGEFTKYSFPSKTMEYLASGVPTLLFKLPGIPQEYYDYCFSMDEFSVEKLAEKITAILHMDSTTLMEMGQKARKFILNNKNPRKQCEKIYKLIEDQI